MFNEYGDVLSTDDVQEILHIGKNAVYSLCKEQRLKSFKIGRAWKIPKTSVSEFIENERSKGVAFMQS